MIHNAVVYDEPEKTLVDQYNALPKTAKQGEYWGEESVTSVRTKIKKHYVREQHYRCCYCNTHIPTEHGSVWTVEHVVAKASHPQFLFEPKNLCTACHDCNIAKSNSRVLVNNDRSTYPDTSDAFRIVHPHFDELNDHIRIVGKRIFLPKTKKGSETIQMCNLLRFAYEYTGWDNELASEPQLMDFLEEFLGNDEVTREANRLKLSEAIKTRALKPSS